MSSGAGRGSAIGDREDRFNAAVDRAVREMLDVEQPAGLRHRVLRRIENRNASFPVTGARASFPLTVASAFRRNLWITAPLAAAAVLILAVLGPWRTQPPAPVRTTPPPVAANNPPVIVPPVPPTATGIESAAPTRTVPPRRPASAAVASGMPSERTVTAAAVADEDTNFTRIAALEGPASIAPRELPEPLPPGLRSIEPAPMLVPALQVAALPETPQTRREE